MKIIKRVLIVVLLLPVLAYTTFYFIEWVKGMKYIDYLASHAVSSPYTNKYDFSNFDSAVASNQLILVGEIHGFKEPQEFDLDFFKYLNEKHDVRTYLVEMDLSQAYFLNEYMKTGDDRLLKKVLSKWVVNAGRDNKTYYEKWEKFREWYQEGHEFKFIGVNNLSDKDLMIEHLFQLVPDIPINKLKDNPSDNELEVVLEKLTSYLENTKENNTTTKVLDHLRRNIHEEIEGTYREEILTENLLSLYEIFGLKEERVYAYLGLGHVLLAPLDGGYRSMALRALDKDNWFQNRILTMVQLFENSHMVMKSNTLPGILQDDGPYTRLAVSYDNILLSYLYGIGDLKRISQENSLTVIPLRGENSPYRSSQRLMSMTKLLPVGQIINASEGYGTTDYGHYLLFFRNSDWAEPFSDMETDMHVTGR